jgi:hypothetical protein
MEIRFSRHSTRRANLYGISKSTIISILKETEFSSGTHEIIQNVKSFRHQLKIVVSVENDILTVITCYPLKKGLKS